MFKKRGTKHYRRTSWAGLTSVEAEKLEEEIYWNEIGQFIDIADRK